VTKTVTTRAGGGGHGWFKDLEFGEIWSVGRFRRVWTRIWSLEEVEEMRRRTQIGVPGNRSLRK
jgi:hypothetical protein